VGEYFNYSAGPSSAGSLLENGLTVSDGGSSEAYCNSSSLSSESSLRKRVNEVDKIISS
jgi:hypothetical protein